MAAVVRTKIDPINRDIELMLADVLSPAARSQTLAQFAGEQIEQAKATNRSILGRAPRMTVTVDGHRDAPLSSVRPDGVVVAEFEILSDALRWIGEQLVIHSPRQSGRYAMSHTLIADGVEVEMAAVVPAADSYVFINTQPYARKIEAGRSSQAPDGVYQAVAVLAARRFGNVAKISFGYRAPMFGAIHAWAGTASASRHAASRSQRRDSARAEWLRRQPAIIVQARS